MARFFGKELDRKELLKRIGHMSQLAYIQPFEYTEGKAQGIKALNVANGTGLEFTLLESKCLDMISMKYKGMNLNFLPKSGIVSPALADMNGTEFMRSISGGMLYTCGLRNVGTTAVDGGLNQVFHGNLKNTPAEKVNAFAAWQGDDYVLKVSGEMNESAIFNENLLLKRTISTKAGAKSVLIEDRVENQGFEEQELMLLYHVNVGFPILDENSRLLIPKSKTVARDPLSQTGIAEFAQLTAPVDGYTEQVFSHETASNSEGMTGAAVINDQLGIGVYIKYNANMLPNLVEWKSMRSGDYALGIMPATCNVKGRTFERESGTLRRINSFETLDFSLEIGVLDGKDDIESFEQFIRQLEGE
ncbi:aldose 1-epimerase family protein [Paenibacillus psychroresistens]|nr:aldose 1-epimerase family protein [Paenibacillus psychroresistens]